MFNKEQLAVIGQQLLLTYESMIELLKLHENRKKDPWLAEVLEKELGPDPDAEVAKVEAMRLGVKEVLDIITSHLEYATFEGQAVLSIPFNDGETWESIHVGSAEDIRKMATEKFGADDFGYVRLVTLGKSN
jgi:hypothetical protein